MYWRESRCSVENRALEADSALDENAVQSVMR